MILFEKKLSEFGVLKGYIHDESEKMPKTSCMPTVVVFPGGGYEFCSEREAEPVALAFFARGFNAFTVKYTTESEILGTKPLYDAALAILSIRQNAKEWHVDKDKIITVGFSAGGHLAGWLGNSAENTILCKGLGCLPEEIRPDFQVLCYPVITGGRYRHENSFKRLFGSDENMYIQASLEKTVNSRTPPAFIWTCNQDKTVAPINSVMFAQALSEAGIDYELHVFAKGGHGLSLASEHTARPEQYAERWLDMCIKYLNYALYYES